MRLTEQDQPSSDRTKYADTAAARGIVPSRYAVLVVISHLANQPAPVTIAELSQLTGVHRGTLYRTLESLESEGWVTAEGQPRRFRLTLRLAQLGLRNLRNNQVREMLMPFATELCLRLQKPTNVGFYEQGEVIITDSVALVNEIAIAFPEGLRVPASCLGPGKILLASQPPEELEKVLARPVPRFNERTKTNPEVIRQEIKATRDRGYGWAFGEFGSRLCTVGLVVRDRDGEPVGAIGFVLGQQYAEGPSEDHIAIAQEIQERASAHLGYRPPLLDR